nr:hypothetical protein [Sulfitobacter sediminilitoris]
MIPDRTGDEDFAGRAESFEPGSDVDAIAVNVSIRLNQYFAKMHSYAQDKAAIFWIGVCNLGKLALDVDRSFNGAHDRRKLYQRAIARALNDATTSIFDGWLGDRIAEFAHTLDRSGLILGDHARETGNISDYYGCKTTFHRMSVPERMSSRKWPFWALLGHLTKTIR